jgi:hypothetical protein
MMIKTYKRKSGTYTKMIKRYEPKILYSRVFELEDSPVNINYIANNAEGEELIKNANSSSEIEAKIKNRKDWKSLLSWNFAYKN